MKPKLSELVAVMGWLSTFVSGWILFLRAVPADNLSATFFCFFLVVAILASAISMERKAIK